MKKITVTTLAALSLCACATGGSMTGSNAGDTAIQGGAIGAVGGYLGCKLLGQSDATCAKVAVATGAVGAAIGWKQGKEKDLEIARAFERKAAADKIPVQTETARVKHRDAGKEESAESWKGSSIGLPQSMLARRDPRLQQTIELSGEMAATRNEATRILVSTSEADRAVVKSWLTTGINRGSAKAKKPEIEFVPLRKGKLAFVHIEPLDQAQFKA